MRTEVVQIPSAGFACEICGDGRISVVIGMGFGAAGSASALACTPDNIAMELHQLRERLPHEEKAAVPAHSQGESYAWKFAKAYPEQVGGPVLLGPLSPENCRFRTGLTEAGFKKSGADKTGRSKHCGRRSCGLMAPAPSAESQPAPSKAAIIST